MQDKLPKKNSEQVSVINSHLFRIVFHSTEICSSAVFFVILV